MAVNAQARAGRRPLFFVTRLSKSRWCHYHVSASHQNKAAPLEGSSLLPWSVKDGDRAAIIASRTELSQEYDDKYAMRVQASRA